MSIAINRAKCVGCKRCIEACPGNLIRYVDKKAVIKREKDCWGCTSCLKECQTGAITFVLSAYIGRKGATLSGRHHGDIREGTVTAPDQTTKTITINKQESNKY